MEKENVVVENNVVKVVKNIGVFVLLLLGYLLLPQIVGLLFYKVFNISETISIFIGNISFLVVLIAVFYKMFKDKFKDYCNNFSNYFGDGLKYWGIGLAVMFISNMIMAYVVFPGEIAANEEINRVYILANPFIGFVSISILAPFIEEMIFRFGLRKMVGKSKFFPLISAFAFGLPHVLTGMTWSLSLNNLLQLLYVIPYGALGYAFGYIYNKTDNILVSMSIHSVHNLMCFFVIVFLS